MMVNVLVIIYSQLVVDQSMHIVFLMLVISKKKTEKLFNLDFEYEFCRYEMSTVDAIDLARRAIVHAAHRDAASGNIVRSMENYFVIDYTNIFV